MTDLDDLRARLRNADRQPVVTGESYAHIYLAALAMLGFVVGAAVVLFLPTLSPLKPSADIPTFQSVREGGPVREPPLPARPVVTPAALDYSADPEELATAADSVCFQRAQARYPSWSKTPRLTTKQLSDFDLKEIKHFNELMTCLLTEQPVRYCAASQRHMIDAEVITYFRGVEHLNKVLDKARKLQAESRNTFAFEPQHIGSAEPDARVIAAIEARLRDGLLTHDDFDRIKGSLPARLRERLAAVPVGTSHCPAPPWWAFWR
jgi:hypothetical protein